MNYASEKVDFEAVAEQIKPRPWLIDNLDALLEVLPLAPNAASPWAKAVVFVDNAGADLVLGVMPLVRQLAAQGTHVVLAANELPSLNDVTADETVVIIEELTNADPELASFLQAGLFEVVSTGNDIPLIDLANVSDELNEACADADLVILEGMGRSVESNLNTAFKVDSMQLCLLKDPSVAARVNGAVFDCVCMYKPVEKKAETKTEKKAEKKGKD
jgi:type II pantothenate kinase